MKEMKVNRSSEEGTSSNYDAASTSTSSSSPTRRTKPEFPIKLYAMLELADKLFEFSQAVTWLPHGRAFKILNKAKFMEEVVPVFFNQTKIRSFNRQLHLWGFRRIGRGNDQVWYNGNFLRGVPRSLKHMVRTKIKGNNTISSNDDGSIPNFDKLPPLPVCDKHPSAVLNVMETSVLKLRSYSGAIAHSVLTMPTLSPPNLALPRAETSCNFYSPDESVLLPCPPVFERAVSNKSQRMMHPWLFHLPLQADITESIAYTNQTSIQGTFQSVHPQMLRANLSDLCVSPLKQKNGDFELLPFQDDNGPCDCDDFAAFIESAIQQV